MRFLASQEHVEAIEAELDRMEKATSHTSRPRCALPHARLHAARSPLFRSNCGNDATTRHEAAAPALHDCRSFRFVETQGCLAPPAAHRATQMAEHVYDEMNHMRSRSEMMQATDASTRGRLLWVEIAMLSHTSRDTSRQRKSCEARPSTFAVSSTKGSRLRWHLAAALIGTTHARRYPRLNQIEFFSCCCCPRCSDQNAQLEASAPEAVAKGQRRDHRMIGTSLSFTVFSILFSGHSAAKPRDIDEMSSAVLSSSCAVRVMTVVRD
eukprot:6213752-Pleurochrysis_carterae.AAC.2